MDGAVAESPATPALLRVRTLIRANVLDLAERIMESQGPPQLPNGEWLNWERQLWALYASRGKWGELVQRIQSIPPAFPDSVRREADLQAIRGHIALSEGVPARRLLRRYLVSGELTDRDRVPLRRQVVESYLVEGLLTEASVAARVFQEDFRPQDREWLLLAARISLQSGNPSAAVNLLAPMDDPAARLLRLWGRLENGSTPPAEVLERAGRMREDQAYAGLQRPLLAIMAASATRAGLQREHARLLEQYLYADPVAEPAVYSSLPRYDLDDLVAAYAAIARAAANEAGYLVGEESGWGDFARLLPAEDGVTRRAVWAHIARQLDDPFSVRLAVDQWINAVLDDDRMPLVTLLHGEDAPLGPLLVSPEVALRLSSAALQNEDIQLAAFANSNVSGPPPGMSYGEWLLYTGRTAIVAGRYAEGGDRLRKWIESRERLTPEETDSVLQPVFDLQTVDQHEMALEFLAMIDDRSPGGKYTREIAFWIAESYEATGQHMKAADYFLFSALQKDNGFDQWGESARYRAADALLNGNFFADARTLLEDLLQRATDENRAKALREKLQQLWLRESNLSGAGGEDGRS